MSYRLTCGEPTNGDWVKFNDTYFPIVECEPDSWIIDLDGTGVSFDGTANGLFAAMTTALLDAEFTISQNESVIVVTALTAETDGSTFTVQDGEMANLEILAQSIRSRGISTDLLSDDDLQSMLTDASVLREYGRYRPLYDTAVFETIADQVQYEWEDIDEDGISISKCLWNGYDLSLSTWFYGFGEWQALILPSSMDYHLPSQEIVERIKLTEFSKYQTAGAFQRTAGGPIILDRAPVADGAPVWLLYTKKYNSVEDIPAADHDIFLDLLESIASERAVKAIAARGMLQTIKTPEYEVNIGTEIGFWRKNGQEKRASFIAKSKAGIAVAARG